MGSAPAGVRSLFRAALVIFVITIVIGILNGTDVWDPPRNTLLTHVHAGTLGWITLSVFGASIWMFGSNGAGTKGLARYAVVALSLYVLAFWSVDLTTSSVQRPIGGTLAFIAIVWMFVWAWRAKRGQRWNVAEVGMILSLAFLVIGAVLGVLLGLQIAGVEVVSPENAEALGGSHPGAMVAGYVVLAALALIEWRMPGREVPMASESKLGVTQMVLMFLAGAVLVGGFLAGMPELAQLAVPLQVAGTLILLGRMRKQLAPSAWRGDLVGRHVRTAVIGLVAVVALLAYVISLFVAGSPFEEIAPALIAMDHLNFIMVITNLVLAILATVTAVSAMFNRLVYWGVNIGVVGFAVGLITESAPLKRVFTPILGLTLLYAIWVHLTAPAAESVPA